MLLGSRYMRPSHFLTLLKLLGWKNERVLFMEERREKEGSPKHVSLLLIGTENAEKLLLKQKLSR